MADKKKYTEPEIKVVEIEDIICSSTQTNAFGYSNGSGYEEATW